MANYPTKATVELVHGANNIARWASLDNDKNRSNIEDRVNWAAEIATEYVNGRLILGRYNLPFAATPKMIIFLSSMLAGILLYDGRLTVAGSSRDEVYHKRKEFYRILRQILSGQLKLLHPTTGEIIESDCETAPLTLSSTTYLCVDLIYQRFRVPVFNIPSAWCNECCCHTCICRSLYLPSC